MYIFIFKIGINYVVGWYFLYTKYTTENIYSMWNNNSKVWLLRTTYINLFMKISVWDLLSDLIILSICALEVSTLIYFEYLDYIYYPGPRKYVWLKKG